ncbi:MFS transporter [Arthrobacter sp. Sa2CUA1]|uniref:MFS transporter n=1 Tax=Arthrobacter gallicola TaxID=2762225 RepID=A0ABR8UQ71_9MICC|nr:MFS transporter [Arthrobacter gallicola]MBD7994715.1 MFS transporter [Arthrobacter gallicola]
MRVRTARARAAGTTATLLGGSAELIDFLLPLWAGAALGFSPAAVGSLIAVELGVSVLARPIAGRLVDTRRRTVVAAAGALLYGLSCLGYALAAAPPHAFAAAILGGTGGALFWIAVRAITAEDLGHDPGALAGLLSSEALGSWFFWIPAMVLLPLAGFSGIFAALAAVCATAAVLLLRVQRALPSQESRAPQAQSLQAQPPQAGAETGAIHGAGSGKPLTPLLLAALITGAAEAGVGLLLLLHLQNSLQLVVYQIALVYLPGGIALTVLPRILHRFVERHGRRKGYAVASVASALTAAGLAFTPGPLAIAALWTLTSASWAILLPIQRAVAAEVSAPRTGRGLSQLSNAELLGAAAGSLLAGLLYDGGTWALPCLVFAGIILSGAILGPLALRRLGVCDRPAPEAEAAAADGGPAGSQV